MEYFKINGGRRIEGSIKLHGAKNSVLPILAASLLIKGESVIHNCPRLSDVENTVKILKYLGSSVKREGDTLIINTAYVNKYDIPEALMREMRSSIIFLGALLSVMNEARVSVPGGCEIGLRPIDLHLKGLKELGYITEIKNEIICATSEKRRSNDIYLSFPSVGATENLILASVFLRGKTRIINSAREPEIKDLCNFLIGAGAKIYGAGNTVIEIEGVKALHETEHTVIPDRILASTLMCASAATGGSIKLDGVRAGDLSPVLSAFCETGCKLWVGNNSLTLNAPKRIKAIKYIKTGPYPDFPTDSQAVFSSMLTVAKGVSVINETVFENRLRHIGELKRFGADITCCDRTAVIHGVKRLNGATAHCTDLRGGAAVVIAALCAEGISRIDSIYHIDRGYEGFEKQLNLLGAAVTRIKDEKEK